MFRFGVVCGGSSLTAMQPYNNIVRVGIENMAAVFGGAQSVFTCAYDEAFQIPTENSAEIALRTQQIVAHESGISRTVDPLGGSYYVEWLTDEMEAGVMAIIDEIEKYGGTVKAIEDGYLQSRIANRALERKLKTDAGARAVIGENYFRHEDDSAEFGEVFRQDPQAARRVHERYTQLMDSRDNRAVETALGRLRNNAVDENENLMPYLVECCHAYATVGEMVATLTREWGEFQEPVRL